MNVIGKIIDEQTINVLMLAVHNTKMQPDWKACIMLKDDPHQYEINLRRGQLSKMVLWTIGDHACQTSRRRKSSKNASEKLQSEPSKSTLPLIQARWVLSATNLEVTANDPCSFMSLSLSL